MKKQHTNSIEVTNRHNPMRYNKQNYPAKNTRVQTKNYLNIMNKNNSLVLLESDKNKSKDRLHLISCNTSSKRSRNLHRQNSQKTALQLPKLSKYKGDKVAPLQLQQKSYNIRQMLGKIFDQKKQQSTIEQEFCKLNHLTKRYSLLRKDLVSIQENLISMNLKSAQRYF